VKKETIMLDQNPTVLRSGNTYIRFYMVVDKDSEKTMGLVYGIPADIMRMMPVSLGYLGRGRVYMMKSTEFGGKFYLDIYTDKGVDTSLTAIYIIEKAINNARLKIMDEFKVLEKDEYKAAKVVITADNRLSMGIMNKSLNKMRYMLSSTERFLGYMYTQLAETDILDRLYSVSSLEEWLSSHNAAVMGHTINSGYMVEEDESLSSKLSKIFRFN
jgi:hypothetical protein